MLTKSDLSQIRKAVKEELANHPTKTDLAKELRPIKDDMAHVRKDIKVIVSFFDREYLELRRRVQIIEQHIGISAS